MADNKSLVEEALLQMKNLEQVVTENAKGILASTMKREISELVKESLKEAEHDEEMDMTEMDEQDAEDIMGLDMDSEEESDEDSEMDMDSDEDEIELDLDFEDDELPIDLTGSSDEEILKIFKAMSDEDGIIVKQDDNQVHVKDENEDVEYIIQLEGEVEEYSMTDEMEEQMDMDVEVSDDEISDEELDQMIADIFSQSEMSEDEDTEEMEEEEDEIVYEIEMDEDEDMDDGSDIIKIDDMEYMDESDVNETKMMIKPVMGNLKNSKLTTKAETKEGAIEPKGRAKGMGMNLSPKKFEFTEEEMEEIAKTTKGSSSKKDFGSGKDEYRRKTVGGVKKKAGEGKDGHFKDYEGNKGDKSKTNMGKMEYEKSEATEAARTYGFGSKDGRGLRKGVSNNRNYDYTKGAANVNEEVQRLRVKNEEYRKALNVFREKLNEVAVFNSNLAYATRLFTEHTTTKQEKINVLRRFDNVENLKESKTLYNSIKNELNNTTQNVVTESVGKIEKSPASGSAQNLIESKTYENPQFLRMKDIMQKITK